MPPADDNRKESIPAWRLHDYLSLGNVEQGLWMTSQVDRRLTATLEEEIQRLPMLLRLLSATRNQVSVSILGDRSFKEEDEDEDPLVNRTVERLEHVAAIHSVAEGVDVVTCYLAPTMTRKLSRVPALAKDPSTGRFDTTDLLEVARNPKGKVPSNNKRQKRTTTEGGDPTMDNGEQSDIDAFSETEGELEEEDASNEGRRKRKRQGDASIRRRTSLEVAAEDSQEATFVKTLSELIHLVVTSLEPIASPADHAHTEDHHNEDPPKNPSESHHYSEGSKSGKLPITIDDSILGETGKDGTGGTIELSDLGSTVAAIMHHAPVLQSRQVANALCRASVPQISNLMARIGANCPTSVPCLLAGCIDAYKAAILHQNTSIASCAKKGILALGELSPRERCRAIYMLQSNAIMWDTQLELHIQEPVLDSNAVATLLVSQARGNRRHSVESDSHRPERSPEQSAGEDPTDDYRNVEEEEQTQTKIIEPSLASSLSKRPILYKKTLEFFQDQFHDMAAAKKRISLAQILLHLKAYCYLLLYLLPPTSQKFDSSFFFFTRMLPVLQALVEKTVEWTVDMGDVSGNPKVSKVDKLIQILHCAVILSAARIFQGGPPDVENKRIESCQELIILLGEVPSPSQRVQGFLRAIESALCHEQSSVLLYHMESVLCSSEIVIDRQHNSGNIPLNNISIGLQQVCANLKPGNLSFSNNNADLDNPLMILSGLLLRLKRGGEEEFHEDVKSWLSKILDGNSPTIMPTAQMEELAARFVSKATQELSKTDLLNVPLVFSLSLERKGYEFLKSTMSNDASTGFLLDLLHAFEYLNARPNSPFVFDPRSLPLKQILRALAKHASTFLRSRLYELSKHHCWDMVVQLERSQITASTGLKEESDFSKIPRSQGLDLFYKILRSYVVALDKGPDAFGSEQVFQQAKLAFSDSDVACTVCSAFSAMHHGPKPVYTYHKLCRDPLVVLKFPLKIWKSRSLRRISIAVLSTLLEANAVLTKASSPFEISAEEFLAARDAVVVRSLLMCICGVGSEVAPSDCSMTSSFIRSILSGHGGLVGTLVKQGLPERSLDWLVENIPECMNDSQELLEVLSDRSSLSAAERLVAADAVIRIAIVQGTVQDAESASMAYAALSHLVESFFLVVGPVGVPVNALMMDDSGLDITQISRRAAFRILKALLRITGPRPRLRKECGIALQKLANQCKSESSVAGVAGATAGRRKTLLKELYDLIMKASSTMGGAFAFQSTAV